MVLFFWIVVLLVLCILFPWMLFVLGVAGIIWLVVMLFALILAHLLAFGIVLLCLALVFMFLVLAG